MIPLDPSNLLLIHNIGYIFSIVLIIFFIGLTYVKDHSSLKNKMFIMAMLSILGFLVSHVIGVNTLDPHLSKMILMWNLSVMLIAVFVAHFVVLVLGKEKQQKFVIISFYVVTIALVIFYIIFPDTFLLDSVPKLYFPNYYVAGNLQWIMRAVSAIIIPVYIVVIMIVSYFTTKNPVLKNKIRYLLMGISFGYIFGNTAIPLVFTAHPTIFGFVIDPIYSILFVPFFVTPFMYAILKYTLFDIKIVAKKAFVYALLVGVVGIFIALLDFSNQIILQNYPGFPQWILPIVSSIIAVSIGFFMWSKLRESDALKSEFITVVTHKFRTPLTQIRWATESLSPVISDEDKNNVLEIARASSRLVDLTNLLVQLSNTDTADYIYHLLPLRLDAIVADMRPEYERRAGLKGIAISFSGSSNRNVVADDAQTRFVIQTLLDNAISYTPKGGTVNVDLNDNLLSVTDSGIGLSKEETGRIFEKFWRSASARKTDTEGMGIGLFMARRIAERQNGTLKVQSLGSGKGTTFLLKLPFSA